MCVHLGFVTLEEKENERGYRRGQDRTFSGTKDSLVLNKPRGSKAAIQ